MKHKVFYWLLIKNRLNTRSLIRRKNMNLYSYVCELCIHQFEEKLRHLFFKCPFAKNCWQAIRVTIPGWLRSDRATRRIQISLNMPFAMEVIILTCWSIWCERNGWLFQNRDPGIQNCFSVLKRELVMVSIGLNGAGHLIFSHG
jgi:predicted nucleic acid-binding Zn ribbon protein